MSNEDFTTFKNGDLTKEEVIAKYHKSRIEGYIRREFANPNRRATTQSLIESNGDNNPRKRRNYDDIDDMNDEERKGLSY